MELEPIMARSGRNLYFCLNTPTITAYPRISGSIDGESQAAQAACHAEFGRDSE
jgi:hypothetical protein